MRPICNGGLGGAWRTVCTAPAFAICAALCAEAAAPARHAKLRTKMGPRQRADENKKQGMLPCFHDSGNREKMLRVPQRLPPPTLPR
jgi:hypothetical protein